jgi:NADPH2:quinone reductase
MKAWRVVRHGKPSTALELLELDTPEPGPGEVRLRVRATALNYNEVDGCHGRYKTIDPPLPYTLGMEALGIVDAAGPGLEAWIGKRVNATPPGAFGAHAEVMIGSVNMTFEAPAALSDTDAAAFFFPFHLAHICLFERGGLQEGETVLVHSGAGGVGSAAIQLGVACGARVLATAGGPAKLDLCRELGADVAIDYRSQDFSAAVLDATDGRGVDVACDLVGGAVTEQTFPCMAFGGRLMLTGFSSGIEAEDRPGPTARPLMFGNFSMGGVLLSYGDAEATRRAAGFNILPRALGDKIQAHLESLLAEGRIRPIVGREAPSADLPQELERMERRETMGRTIIRW